MNKEQKEEMQAYYTPKDSDTCLQMSKCPNSNKKPMHGHNAGRHEEKNNIKELSKITFW